MNQRCYLSESSLSVKQLCYYEKMAVALDRSVSWQDDKEADFRDAKVVFSQNDSVLLQKCCMTEKQFYMTAARPNKTLMSVTQKC
jgi:hypothetical protein